MKWLEPSGAGIIEFAEAKEVNMHGGLLDMKGRPALGSVIELTNLTSTKTASARVVSLRPSKESEVLGVAVELLTPSQSFWGATFRLKMAIDDLLKLEKAIRSGGMDPLVLREFRDAVDYLRKTAWALQELQERQAHQRDTATVRSLLSTPPLSYADPPIPVKVAQLRTQSRLAIRSTHRPCAASASVLPVSRRTRSSLRS